MRTLVVTEFITLDGVVEAPGGEPTHPHAGWTMAYGSEEMFGFKMQETLDAESMLLGRTTYEGFSAAWPDRDGPFAEKMNAMPKHVVTSSEAPLAWNSTRLVGPLADGVAELKAGDGGPILIAGSASLVRALLPLGLVDELRLLVFPVIVGGGLGIWPTEREKVPLTLSSLREFENGVTLQIFGPG